MIMKRQILKISALILTVLALAFCFSFKGGTGNDSVTELTTNIVPTTIEEETKEVSTTCSTSVTEESTTEVIKKTNDEIAKEVLAGKWGNNPERKKRIEEAGYDYEEIQKLVDNLTPAPIETSKPSIKQPNNQTSYSENPRKFISDGVIYYGGYVWTWYSQRSLPGYGLNIPGRHVDKDGFVCDGDGYICLAYHSDCHGMIINTPFGK